jgi:hypothetical protein
MDILENLINTPSVMSFVTATTIFTFTLVLSWFVELIVRSMAKAKQSDGRQAGNTEMFREMDRWHLETLISGGQLLTVPLVLLAAAISLLHWQPVYFSPAAGMTLVAGGLLLLCINFVRLMRTQRCYRLAGLIVQNRLATVQALIPLIHQGYYLFHDIATDGNRIDHLAVGPKGIFTFDVFTPQIKTNPRGSTRPTVTYDGRSLFYGNKTDYEIIDQTQIKAQQISEKLSGMIDEPVAARAIIAIPGWTIKRTSTEGISVVNPKQFASLFAHIQARPLALSEIQKIVDCLSETSGAASE